MVDRGILWLLVCGYLVRAARRRLVARTIGFAAASALVYGLAFVAITPACSSRLTLPLVLVGALGLAHVVHSRRFGDEPAVGTAT